MSERAWTCSSCGTVNDAGARRCQTCGKWPSLFDLDSSPADDAQEGEIEDSYYELGEEELEPEAATVEQGADASAEPTRRRGRSRRRVLFRFIVPLALLVYLVISSFLAHR
jgi:predicted ATP-dependent serine protease